MEIPKEKNIRRFFTNNKDILIMFFIYTVFFGIVFLLGFGNFIFHNGKGFVWDIDGVKQHLPFLYDFAQSIKDHHLSAWSWEMGFGADVIHSYTYYLLGDPLSLLIGLLIPLNSVELAYSAMIVFRLFLVGASFLLYCRHMSLKVIPSVMGALIYAFSIQIIFWGIRHPFFINSAYILPVLYIGIDKFFTGKRPYLFILSVAFNAVNNFYFFYINTLAIIIYVVIRYFCTYRNGSKAKEIFIMFFKLVFYYIVGLLISSFLFLPSVYAFLNSSRGINGTLNFYPYDWEYLSIIFRNLFAFSWEKQITEITTAAIVLPGTVIALLYSKKHLSHKVMFLVYSVFLCFPIAYSMFNGFSTPTFRWLYVYIFLLALLTAVSISYMEKIKLKGLIFPGTITISYIFLFFNRSHFFNKYFFVSIFFIFCLFILLLVIKYRKRIYVGMSHAVKREESIKTSLLFNSVLLLLVCFNIITSIQGLMDQDNYGGQFKESDTVIEAYKNDITGFVNSNIDDDSFYRVDYNDDRNNKAVVNNLKSTSTYNSIVNKNIIDFFLNNNIRTNFYRSGYIGVDNISALEAILGVKYYIVNKDEKYAIPYGFEEYVDEDNFIIYKNNNYLPLGFMYNKVVSTEALLQYDDVYKTQIMLDAAVIDNPNDTGINQYNINSTVDSVSYDIKETKGLIINDNNISVNEKGAKLVIETEGKGNDEIYLAVDDIRYKNNKTSFEIQVNSDNVAKYEETLEEDDAYFMDNHDYLINMGYEKEGKRKITLKFPVAGDYTFDSIKVYRVNMEGFNDKINDLSKRSLKDIEYTNTTISGNITSDEKGILFLSIPYSKGWVATVDGKKVDTLTVNTGFTGILLDKGFHDIQLEYHSPWLKLSLLISLLGIIILLIIIYQYERKQ